MRRLDRLRSFLATSTTLSGNALDRATAYVAIESTNLWSGYCRAYYLSSALGARDSAGNPVLPPPQALSNEEAALTAAVEALKPKVKTKGPPWTWADEPKWGEPKQLRIALKKLGASNYPTLESALGWPTTVFDDLPTFRNFYAHRGKGTALRAKNAATKYLIPPNEHPTRILHSYPSGAVDRLLDGWIADLREIIDQTA